MPEERRRIATSPKTETPLRFAQAVRRRAWDAAIEYGKSFTGVIAMLQLMFYGDRVAGLPDERRRDVLSNRQLFDNFIAWYLFEVHMKAPNVTDELLAKHGGKLAPAERRYLEAMRKSQLRLYEVESVTRDVGLRLRDCWSNEAFDVRERMFTHDAVANMIVALRLMREPSGDVAIDGSGLAGFNHADKDAILQKLRGEHEACMKTDGNSDGRFEYYHAPVIAQHWIERFLLAPPMRLTTSTGDPMMLCTVRFEIGNRPALPRALAKISGLRRNGDEYTWSKQKTIHATFRIEGNFLVAETLSEKRAHDARRLIERGCDASILRFRAIERKEPMEALAEYRASGAAQKPVNAVPPEIAARVIADYEERHYRTWLDTPLPALGNTTPRQATRDRALRQVLVGLLKDFSVASARARANGGHGYDFSWMWGELGIDPADPMNLRTRRKPTARGTAIYQLKIALQGSKPPIWRRVLVAGNERLDRLHMILNAAMGWTDSHLHAFDVGGVRYSDSDAAFGAATHDRDERKVKLQDLGLAAAASFQYSYDFGDGWEHRVTLEKIVAADPAMRYPHCTGGRRACPPENVGGIWGYDEWLRAPGGQAEYGFEAGEFDPEAFDAREATIALRALPKRR